MKAPFSFSRDFKKQYHSRDKKTRSDIDQRLAEMADLVAYANKKKIPLKKAKMSLRLRASSESLSIVIISGQAPKVIARRVE